MPINKLKIFRVLFPSWRFFESITPTAKIYYRISRNGIDYSAWRELSFSSQPRTLFDLWHNPNENLRLTYHVQLEQLVNDLATLEPEGPVKYTDWPSYRIVMAAVKQTLNPILSQEGRYFQVKIGAIEFSKQPTASTVYGQWSDSVIFPSQEI